jgi:hypothetical protein
MLAHIREKTRSIAGPSRRQKSACCSFSNELGGLDEPPSVSRTAFSELQPLNHPITIKDSAFDPSATLEMSRPVAEKDTAKAGRKRAMDFNLGIGAVVSVVT